MMSQNLRQGMTKGKYRNTRDNRKTDYHTEIYMNAHMK